MLNKVELKRRARVAAAEKRERRMRDALMLLGGVCAECGTDENLEFDHIDPETKDFNISQKIGSHSWATILAELDKCQLLCVTHHDVKTAEERMVHGSKSRYYDGCRCAECIAGHAEYLEGRRRV